MEKVDRPLGPVVVDIAGTSLTDEEVKQIDEALEQIGVDIVCTPADEEAQPYFTHYPLFGLPAEVEDCVILYR